MAPSVLITGCSAGGIGAGLAHAFHQRGYHVFATARNPSRIPESLASSPRVTPLALDVLEPASIAAAVDSVRASTGGTLDVLVNNSGSHAIGPALDASIEEGRRVFDLNVWAPLAMLQGFAPLLIEARGCLVNNASCSAYMTMPMMSVYNSSKAALIAASDTWRRELKPLGVRTITLATTSVTSEALPGLAGNKIPASSPYYGIADFVATVPGLLRKSSTMTVEQYAAQVLREVERGTSGTVWAGSSAGMSRWMVTLSPQSVIDMIVESVIPFYKAMAEVGKGK